VKNVMTHTHQLKRLVRIPMTSGPLTCKPFIGERQPLDRQTSTRQAWRRGLPRSKQGRSQALIMRTCAGLAKADHHSLGSHAQQEMEAFIPTDAMTPANIGLTCHPPQATPIRVASDCCRALQRPFAVPAPETERRR
jgi:hypothetical protein